MVSDDGSRASGTETGVQADAPRSRLRRELGVMEAAALSISIMAPTAAMAVVLPEPVGPDSRTQRQGG